MPLTKKKVIISDAVTKTNPPITTDFQLKGSLVLDFPSNSSNRFLLSANSASSLAVRLGLLAKLSISDWICSLSLSLCSGLYWD